MASLPLPARPSADPSLQQQTADKPGKCERGTARGGRELPGQQTAQTRTRHRSELQPRNQENHTCHVELEYLLVIETAFQKTHYLILNDLRVGSLSSLYCQSFVSPSTALHQLLMFILSSNGKNSPLRLRPLSPYSAFSPPFYSIRVAKMIFLQLKI